MLVLPKNVEARRCKMTLRTEERNLAEAAPYDPGIVVGCLLLITLGAEAVVSIVRVWLLAGLDTKPSFES